MNWMINAACRTKDPETWFPVSEIGPGATQVAEAKAVCAGCPVREDCLEFALALGLDYGVFGGMSASERRKLVRTR
jgi:WhiB family transcriptional regulator, redox-sensing transcriptional regulator